MKKIITAILLILLMSCIAAGEQLHDWPWGKNNVIPDHIEGVMYDFEEGTNCAPFDNQYPDIAQFLIVDGTQPYGSDIPSYVTIGGSTCGNTRCYMRIYPWCGYYPNGTPYEWVNIVNGNDGFAPITGPDHMGGYIPGTESHIEFKEGTTYVSFIASTGWNLYVSLYDKKGNRIHSDKIVRTIDRVGTEPSNFTEFSFHSENIDIARMELNGPFNGWQIDDLIVGGAPGYFDKPVDYTSASERLKLLIGADFNLIAFGYNPVTGTFYTADEIINGEPLNWDPYNKELSFTPGICDVGAIIWAVNGENNENVINNAYIDNMANKDFTWWVTYGDQRPGDVAFIDYEADGYYDEVIMFIEPQIDPETGVPEDCIRILEEGGVHYTDSEYLHAIYGIDNGVGVQSFMDVKRLPESPKGGKSPYKKMPGKYKKSI